MILTLLIAPLTHADATSFRCGSQYLAAIGDHMYVVRKHCGEPASEHKIGEKEISKDNFLYLTEWIYEKDQGVYILTFEGSRLIKKEYIK
jgi:hypothetical protein